MYEAEKEQIDKRKNISCVNYWVFNSSSEHIVCGHTACYAGICTDGKPGCIVINNIQRRHREDTPRRIGTESCHMYLDWLLNRSPYADSFISKDADECFQENLVVSTCDVQSQILLGGMIALRGMWEASPGNEAPILFKDMVEAGVHEDFAFILGHCFFKDLSKNLNNYGGHQAIAPRFMEVNHAVNFMKHTHKGGLTLCESANYSGVHNVWGIFSGFRGDWHEWLANALKNLKANNKVSSSGVSNPFRINNAAPVTTRVSVGALAEVYNKFKSEFLV